MKNSLTIRMLVVDGTEGRARVTTSTLVVPQDFQFIDLSVTSTEQKRQNRTLARSHAMKVVRGGQRRKRLPLRPISRKSNVPFALQEEEIETIWSDSASRTSKWQDICSAGFAASMAQGFHSRSLSLTHGMMVENDILPLQIYSRKYTPVLHVCIQHCKILLRFESLNHTESSYPLIHQQ
jgi:hypothetical protein